MYDKKYYEKFALYSLEFFFKEKLGNFFCAEKPDLQNFKDGTGIEVTRGITEYEGKFSRFCEDCAENNLSLSSRVEKGRQMFRKNFLGVIHESNAPVIASPDNGNNNSDKHIEIIYSKILKKSEKLNTIYQKFYVNGLYIFAEYPINLRDIVIISNRISKMKKGYDIYFINAPGKLYIINAKDGYSITKHDYEASEQGMFAQKARIK